LMSRGDYFRRGGYRGNLVEFGLFLFRHLVELGEGRLILVGL
jgi:hypothetical protein